MSLIHAIFLFFSILYKISQSFSKLYIKILIIYFPFYILSNILEEKSKHNLKSRNTVMVCDDDRDLLYLYQQALGSNYSILAVDSGIECISKYIDEKPKGNKVNVLLLDYKLPDLTGDIVATTIRDLNGRIRITNTILISAFEVDKELIEDLKRKDCIIESVKKPISIDSLIKIIENATIA
jgi:CheY-like chemotaxis protein